MLTDKQIVEDCIPLVLFVGTIRRLLDLSNKRGDASDEQKATLELLEIFKSEKDELLNSLDSKKKQQIKRRLNRIVLRISTYFSDNRFTPLKALTMITEWVIALNNAGGLAIPEDSKYMWALQEIKRQLDLADDYVNGWDKLENSARKQVNKVHKLCQLEGYY